ATMFSHPPSGLTISPSNHSCQLSYHSAYFAISSPNRYSRCLHTIIPRLSSWRGFCGLSSRTMYRVSLFPFLLYSTLDRDIQQFLLPIWDCFYRHYRNNLCNTERQILL